MKGVVYVIPNHAKGVKKTTIVNKYIYSYVDLDAKKRLKGTGSRERIQIL